VKPELNRKLAFTGTEDTLLLGALAFALLLAGTWLWRKGSKL
jgi:LPXTG-motif cell wall-anchored protein